MKEITGTLAMQATDRAIDKYFAVPENAELLASIQGRIIEKSEDEINPQCWLDITDFPSADEMPFALKRQLGKWGFDVFSIPGYAGVRISWEPKQP